VTLLQVEALVIASRSPDGAEGRVVDDVTLQLDRGARLGIAGESGSGKSTLLLALMGLVRPGLRHLGGSVRFEGHAMLGPGAARLRGGRVALVPQNAGTAMTPTLRIGMQIDEALALHTGLSAPARAARIGELLRMVRLPEPDRLARRFPHELSGGQVQRAAVAMALAGGPDLLLLDEPTTGLDVTTQLAILDLLGDLGRETGVAMICVSHDLGVLSRLCDRLAVMYAGALAEAGPVAQVLAEPAHPYTRALLASVPRLSHPGLPPAIPGAPPGPFARPPGCAFAPRCARAQADCHAIRPALATTESRAVACLHPETGPQALAAPGAAAAPAPEPGPPVLEVKGLSISYARGGLLARLTGRTPAARAVEDVSLDLGRGEVLGLVGESGSGKSSILQAITGLWPRAAGTITLTGPDGQGMPLAPRTAERSLDLLRPVQLVFQNPDASLNPRQRIAGILAQPLGLYHTAGQAGLRGRAAELLAEMRLGPEYLDRLPARLSGGERQRVAIARAFAADPQVILCDEVTTALDVSVQAAVLRLLRDQSRRRGVAAIFVSHDLAVVRAIADRIAVLYAGRIVEIGPADAVCSRPRHPYTRALLAAVLEPGAPPAATPSPLPERAAAPEKGCAFAPRCPLRMDRCLAELPELAGQPHAVRCHAA
jgi:peptide/nickel transport system ATP-binding protein